MFQSWKRRSQNLAFLDTLGYLVTLRPNGFSQLHQILHASSQDLGTSSCKILNTCVASKCRFSAKNAQKRLKTPQIWIFWAYMLFLYLQDLEIWHDYTSAPHEHTCQISKAQVQQFRIYPILKFFKILRFFDF